VVLWKSVQNWVVVEFWCALFWSQDRRDSGSILIPSVSYSQDAEFYPLSHIGEGGLATEAAKLLNCNLVLTVVPNKDTVLVCLIFYWGKDEYL
jgi:hypothetical protein